MPRAFLCGGLVRAVLLVGALARPLDAAAQSTPSAPPVSPGVLTPPAGSRVKAGYLVRPDTVEVGDPFTLVVTVVVPEGSRIEWPRAAARRCRRRIRRRYLRRAETANRSSGTSARP